MKLNDPSKKELIQNIEEMEAWERLETSIKDVSITKLPEFNDKQIVFLELNINPKSKKGIFIKSVEEYQKLKEIILKPELESLIQCINEYYPDKKKKLDLVFMEGVD